LERRGYRVWRVHGYKQIDLGRNQMASDAPPPAAQETLWIDADTGFHPDAIEQLDRTICRSCAASIQKNKRELTIRCRYVEIVFGKGAG
jgi:hypothetical protein